MSDGWKCPVCGRGVAPSEKHCEHGGGDMLFPVMPPPLFPDTSPLLPPRPWWEDGPQVTISTGQSAIDAGGTYVLWN